MTTDPTIITNEGVTVTVRNLTPSDAEEILENNHVNRAIRRDLVAAYRRDMNSGKWRQTGEPIQISRTGALLNGQHRMTALAGSKAKRVQTGLPFVVISGLTEESQALMDQGAARTVRDALMIQFGHVTNVNLVSSIGRWLTVQPEVNSDFTPSTLRTKVSTAEVLETYRKNEDLLKKAAHHASFWNKIIPGSPTAMGYTFCQFYRIDPSAAEEFFAGMMDMNWKWPDDPRKAALRRLQIMVKDQNYRANLENAYMVVSLLTRTWNLWRKGEKVTTIHLRGRTGVIEPVRPIS